MSSQLLVIRSASPPRRRFRVTNIFLPQAKQQTIGSAGHFPEGLNSTNFPPDGLLGLAFQSLSRLNATPVFQTLAAQGAFPANSFGFYLANEGSEVYLGGTNNKLHKDDFVYASVTQEVWLCREVCSIRC